MKLPIAAAAIALALALGGCGTSSKQSTPAVTKLQREDLVAASRALKSAEVAVAGEVSATKTAWPLIAGGLPAAPDAVATAQIKRAANSAAQLRLPALFGEAQARSLTGPASQLAGLFRSYALLSARGWKLVGASLQQSQAGSSASARFARENAVIYIESVYDGHFTLAQIGKKLRSAYDKLGGAGAFGAALTQAQVDALTQTYSEAHDRLHPHAAAPAGS